MQTRCLKKIKQSNLKISELENLVYFKCAVLNQVVQLKKKLSLCNLCVVNFFILCGLLDTNVPPLRITKYLQLTTYSFFKFT